MSHSTDRDDYDYPVIDRADDDPDRPEIVDRDPDGTEADPHAEAEYHATRPEDGTTILPADPEYDGSAPGVRDTDRDDDGTPDVVDLTDDRVTRDRDDTDVTGAADDTRADTADDTPRTGETTVVAVDDVAAQDSGVVLVPPATDDARDARPVTDPDATPGPAAEVAPAAAPAGADTGDADDEARWRDLQVLFVDDPAAAVREAAELLERAVADLRQRHEGSESTEDLRTAFRKYRDVHRGLR